MRFADRVALVTGGGSGIGRAVAVALAHEGASVVVTGRSSAGLRETVALIDGPALAVPADVTDPDAMDALFARIADEYGRLDTAVNSAGTIGAAGPVGDVDRAEWQRLLDVNLTGVLVSMQYEIAAMRGPGRTGGTIVNVASNLGAHRRMAGLGAYAASKAAVSALTRAAALDHIREGIRINAVSPGPADTAMSLRPGEGPSDRDARLRAHSPIGRVGGLDEIASAVLYLASAESGYAVGTDLVVDGGAAA
ncbi:SDR family NAD(P)-dependent oxidoreductase [Cryptosporangium phraense]|uniref:SDR family oxidoreductase n=1 Tax=Cryptosporangium phraense TaxID=2593070 RepID=A0A545ARK8_9ACTN|nr:SDR family oxidoreductase [Cryptosporangium phraense]TQS43978.1 SDR family oxidoreductase [Cryptosporangium phraense]